MQCGSASSCSGIEAQAGSGVATEVAVFIVSGLGPARDPLVHYTFLADGFPQNVGGAAVRIGWAGIVVAGAGG